MKFEDFQLGRAFWTATGKWLVTGFEENGKDSEGYPTNVVFAIPLEPNLNICKSTNEHLQMSELTMEFYDYDFGGCDLTNRFKGNSNG